MNSLARAAMPAPERWPDAVLCRRGRGDVAGVAGVAGRGTVAPPRRPSAGPETRRGIRAAVCLLTLRPVLAPLPAAVIAGGVMCLPPASGRRAGAPTWTGDWPPPRPAW